ncbi:hypothetical protein BT63DRAFT_428468 [Microthyrium microscopicum]|uniref:DAGKc domain-containing protein n=1 Tax=Microthyrium microscopicum TaxID=703497 RepID=A0A6A6U0P1_9PEZI|nr:hypothetical protein BT63DRAFT_428468 [Microthyrium microscopicum]
MKKLFNSVLTSLKSNKKSSRQPPLPDPASAGASSSGLDLNSSAQVEAGDGISNGETEGQNTASQDSANPGSSDLESTNQESLNQKKSVILTGAVIGRTANTFYYLKVPKDDAEKELPELGIEARHDVENAAQLAYPFTLPSDIVDTKVYVVISTLSGTQLATSFYDNILAPLLKRLKSELDISETIHVERTKDARSVIDLTNTLFASNANQGIRQLIILLSGDGGIVDVLNELPTTISSNYLPPQVSLIPLGTGNALAQSSGIADETWGLSTLARGHAKALPTFIATFSSGARLLVDEARQEEELSLKDEKGHPYMRGAVVCSWGMHAGLVADSDTAEYRKFGVERFKMAAKEALYPEDGAGPHHYKAKLSLLPKGSTHWKKIERTEHAYVLTTLVSNLEKGFTISPESAPLQGSMRIVHFGPMAGDEIMQLMTKAYQGGQHISEESVSYEEVDGVRISFEGREDDARWRRICVDGKIIRLEADGWVEIRKEPRHLLSLRHLSR